MNKYLALRKDVFDISKITVVGTPTITSDGVASGFNGGNYVLTPSVNAGNNFQVEVTIKIGVLTETTQHVFGGYKDTNNLSGNLLIANTNRLWLVGYTQDGAYTNVGNYIIEENSEYKVKAIYTDTYIEYYVNDVFVAKSNNNFKVPNSIRIGGDTLAFRGLIDLKQFKIYVDNQLVFQPVKPTYLLERRKEGYDPSKFTIVGSPTITEDGVASGFSGGNYATCSLENPVTQDNIIQIEVGGIYKTYSSVQVPIADGGFRLVFNPSIISFWNISTNKICEISNTLQDNDNFKIIAIFNNTVGHTLKLYKNGNLVVSHTNISTVESLSKQHFNLGIWGPSDVRAWQGSIDLPSTSITVDGKEVFTGAKENYYMLRR